MVTAGFGLRAPRAQERKSQQNSSREEVRHSVKFHCDLRMILIPCRGEFKRAGLYESLWWAAADFLQFQASANSEIRMLVSYEGIGAKMARFKLYQPGSESIDPDEFRAFAGDAEETASSTGSSPSSSTTDLSALAVKFKASKSARLEAIPPNSSQSPLMCPSPGGDFGAKTAAPGAIAPSSLSNPNPHSNPGAIAPSSSAASSQPSLSLVPRTENQQFRQELGQGGPKTEEGDEFWQLEAEAPDETKEEQWPGNGLEGLGSGLELESFEDLDDIVFSAQPHSGLRKFSVEGSRGMRKVSSLDCVKSALRVPLPESLDEDEDEASRWTWNGKLRAAVGAGRRAGQASSSKAGPLAEEGFWRLCVAVDKPNGLDGQRKCRFTNRHYGHEEMMSGMGLLSLLAWVGAFALVAYLIFDGGNATITPPDEKV